MVTNLWRRKDKSLEQTLLAAPITLEGDVTDEHGRPQFVIAPVRDAGEAVAAALVPAALERTVSRNGIPLLAGMSLLHHADRIDIGARTFWVSVAAQAEHAEYGPDVHGQDVFCFLTKARLKPNEPITICPGRPEKACRMIYKRTAWEMAIEASTFKCPNCQFDPHQPTWQPPPERPTTMLDDLFRMLSEESGQ